ncbi:MAG TPA: SigE family RNA polymerase sigma factor [Mycobacteriales bacterium]|nr:SigE family RNA polymerase sigma factor [Mycobacteriales bacterium]
MTSPEWEQEFAAYAAARSRLLCTTAFLLCGDWHRAEDHAQTALTKLYLAWRRIDRRESVDAYARRVLVRTVVDEHRRPWRREHPAPELPERAARADPADDRLDLLAALARLPARQRAAVVLRYWADLDIAETARVLGVSEGTVKSSSSKGLAALRGVLQDSRTGGATREGRAR